MPADTKLYLYLDPGRLIGDAPWTFDARQFAGWVPHQVIAYLWPQGPWYWLGETVGLPDWITHRLWIGTLFLAAGTGVLWLARRLGLSLGAALAAALVYQLAPYLLPYVSRTSAMLLPWAGLGLDRRAHRPRRHPHPLAPRRAVRPRRRHGRGGQRHRPADDRPGAGAVAAGRRRASGASRGAGRPPRRRASAGSRSACRCGGSRWSSSRAAAAPTCWPTRSRWSRSATRRRRPRCGAASATG